MTILDVEGNRVRQVRIEAAIDKDGDTSAVGDRSGSEQDRVAGEN